jgi:hypothetical protein
MFPEVISLDPEPHGIDGPVGSSFSNYQYPVIGMTSPFLCLWTESKLIYV